VAAPVIALAMIIRLFASVSISVTTTLANWVIGAGIAIAIILSLAGAIRTVLFSEQGGIGLGIPELLAIMAVVCSYVALLIFTLP